MPTKYRREGDLEEAWNALIRRVNELAEDCEGVEPLEEVDEKHRWSKRDVREMQDKLKEICDETEFSDVPDKWKQSIIDEFIEAVESGACCCEEEDKDDFPNRDDFPENDGFVIFETFGFESRFAMYDWAGWIMQETEPLEIELIDCFDENGEVESQIERRKGGRGWVGREFDRWEMYAYTDRTGPQDPIASGDIVDGYIDIGEGQWSPQQVCGEPEEPGTPLGEADEDWGFNYEVELISEGPPENRQHFWRVSGEDGREIIRSTGDPSFRTEGVFNPTWVTSPYVIQTQTGPPGGNLTVHERHIFLRLICKEAE